MYLFQCLALPIPGEPWQLFLDEQERTKSLIGVNLPQPSSLLLHMMYTSPTAAQDLLTRPSRPFLGFCRSIAVLWFMWFGAAELAKCAATWLTYHKAKRTSRKQNAQGITAQRMWWIYKLEGKKHVNKSWGKDILADSARLVIPSPDHANFILLHVGTTKKERKKKTCLGTPNACILYAFWRALSNAGWRKQPRGKWGS